jgi:polyvinyl alcohol dehydrogenase (cytochrome)
MTGLGHDAFIDASTANRLVLLWTRPLKDVVASQPTVSFGRVFIGDWSGTEYALDAESGDLLATVDLGRTNAPQCGPAHLGITSTAAIWAGTLYLAGGDNGFYALDPDSLAIRWRTALGDNSPAGGYYGWCSPAVVDGQVLQGVSSNCDNPLVPGRLVALDAASGQAFGAADLMPPDEVGAGVWTSPAVDVPVRSVFVTTGNAQIPGEGLGSSILRLALDDLSIEDAWQVDFLGTPDADWGSSPTLFHDRNSRRLVGAGQKDGFYYAFVREAVGQGPVWQTQLARGGPCPECCDGTLSTAAFDGVRLYVGAGAPPGTDPQHFVGSVSALDPATGAILWQQTFEGGPVIAPITVVNDVLFVAGPFQVAALSCATGAPLWSHPSPGWFYGGVAVAEGKVFAADTYGFLYAFGLP